MLLKDVFEMSRDGEISGGKADVVIEFLELIILQMMFSNEYLIVSRSVNEVARKTNSS